LTPGHPAWHNGVPPVVKAHRYFSAKEELLSPFVPWGYIDNRIRLRGRPAMVRVADTS